MAVTKIKPVKSTLSKALDYIENPDKTDGKILISSFGCSYETADIEFGYTLSQARDKGNNLAFHLIQSFAPGEVDYEKAHEIGRQLADAVTKGQHEYVLTTHIDKGHIHNHIIFCAVNFVDHHKYVSNKRTYYGIRNMSDKLCRDNGLSVVVPGKGHTHTCPVAVQNPAGGREERPADGKDGDRQRREARHRNKGNPNWRARSPSFTWQRRCAIRCSPTQT